MPIIECFECSGRVSSTAKSCPHCGNTEFLEQYGEMMRKNKERIQFINSQEYKDLKDNEARKEGFSNAKQQEWWRDNGEVLKFVFAAIIVVVCYLLGVLNYLMNAFRNLIE